MSINGFRIESETNLISLVDFHSVAHVPENKFYSYFNFQDRLSELGLKIQLDTGTRDREGTPIYEGDTLKQVSCEQTFKVDDIVSFLIMCGRYEEKHGTPIFDSLEIVNE